MRRCKGTALSFSAPHNFKYYAAPTLPLECNGLPYELPQNPEIEHRPAKNPTLRQKAKMEGSSSPHVTHGRQNIAMRSLTSGTKPALSHVRALRKTEGAPESS